MVSPRRLCEQRFIASVKAHPGSPRRFDDFLIYIEDNLLDLRALSQLRGLDFRRCAETYIETVIQAWRQNVQDSDASTDRLRQMLHDILEVL